jgi:hypothetical protein
VLLHSFKCFVGGFGKEVCYLTVYRDPCLSECEGLLGRVFYRFLTSYFEIRFTHHRMIAITQKA